MIIKKRQQNREIVLNSTELRLKFNTLIFHKKIESSSSIDEIDDYQQDIHQVKHHHNYNLIIILIILWNNIFFIKIKTSTKNLTKIENWIFFDSEQNSFIFPNSNRNETTLMKLVTSPFYFWKTSTFIKIYKTKYFLQLSNKILFLDDADVINLFLDFIQNLN